MPFGQRFVARPFPQGLQWINTPRPIRLQELRGKFVLLDFWTLGCINCMHIIPELRKLEGAWPNELVVIGVHSAKFAREKDTKSIAEAVLRYRVHHPVVNDANFAIWNSYGVRAWPSLVLIDPEGYAIWAQSGEATFEQLNGLLRKAALLYRARRSLSNRPMRFNAPAVEPDSRRLRFPGKIVADAVDKRLFIADSGHNRIVVTRLDGSVLAIIGSGASGRADGDYSTATFNSPQGMALAGDALYVADTENHLIRKVDLTRRRVTTVAGTGRQNREPPPPGAMRKPLATALSSPWDLLVHAGDVYIAMAGIHQIWILKGDGSAIGVYAGTGREDIVDGLLRPRRVSGPQVACFAQPSGLTSNGDWLYVADSEGSSIRAVPFENAAGTLRVSSPGYGGTPSVRAMTVRTVVGTAKLATARLFTFGNVDGSGPNVLLQHPLGIVYYDGKLYVADTYNNKIKVVDPTTGDTQTVAGQTTPGRSDDLPTFDQPGGIAAALGKLYVADTNNHVIRTIDLSRGNIVATLPIVGLKSAQRRSRSAVTKSAGGLRSVGCFALAAHAGGRPRDSPLLSIGAGRGGWLRAALRAAVDHDVLVGRHLADDLLFFQLLDLADPAAFGRCVALALRDRARIALFAARLAACGGLAAVAAAVAAGAIATVVAAGRQQRANLLALTDPNDFLDFFHLTHDAAVGFALATAVAAAAAAAGLRRRTRGRARGHVPGRGRGGRKPADC